MNYKHKAEKLKSLKRDRVEQVRILQKEISKINTTIDEYMRLYKKQNEYSDKCKAILAGRSRQNVRDIIMFIMDSLKNNETYFKYYKDIDLDELMKNESFFDFTIVEIGKTTIKNITDKFIQVVTNKDGEHFIQTSDKHPRGMTENEKIRLWKKLTKKTIIQEAKRITQEQRSNNE